MKRSHYMPVNKFGKTSIITAGLVLPLALVLSGLVTWYLKTNNPDGVDITAGLAYLRPTLITAFVTFGLVWAISLVTGLLGLKRDASVELSRTGLTLLALVTVLSVISAISTNQVSRAEDLYREQNSALEQN